MANNGFDCKLKKRKKKKKKKTQGFIYNIYIRAIYIILKSQVLPGLLKDFLQFSFKNFFFIESLRYSESFGNDIPKLCLRVSLGKLNMQFTDDFSTACRIINFVTSIFFKLGKN